MDYSANEVKVGLVVVIGFLVLLGFIGAIVGVKWSDDTKEYQTYLKNVSGIVEGSLVKFGGMDVGHVTKVRFPEIDEDESRIEIDLKVDKKTPVRTNSQAFVTSIGIMANHHLEISRGTPDKPLLPSGSLLPSKEVLSLMQMAEPFGEMTDDIGLLVQRFADLFNDNNRAHLASVIENMDAMVSQSGENLVNLVGNLDKLTGNLSEVSNGLNSLMSDNKENFDETLGHLEQTTRETSHLISDLRKSLAGFEDLLSANGSSIIEIMENFQFASQNLEEFTRSVKEKPWLLVRKAGPPERKLP